MADKRLPKRPRSRQKPAGLLEAVAPGPCSFCGRTPLEHEGLQFQKGNYRICADCVSRMHRELQSEEKP